MGLDEHDKNRVTFNEVTKDAVKDAFNHARTIDMDTVDAQQARRVLDRLVGYSLSPILWSKVKKGLSAGRVQSVALKLVIDREKEIKAFKPIEYWTIEAEFAHGKSKFQGSFYGLKGKKADLPNNKAVQDVLAKLDKKKPFAVTKVVKREVKRQPAAPFTTSTMQQEANRRLNFRTSKTMSIAQHLYEGVSLGREGTVGLITYMRTDSKRISPVARAEAAKFIDEEYGAEYAVKKERHFKNQEDAQDAHEAVRPTSVYRTPKSLEKVLTKDELRLYTLIWSRFVASEMTSAVFDTARYDLTQNDVTFRASGSVMKFAGYTKVYDNRSDKNIALPDLAEGAEVKMTKSDNKQHFTQPPARYTEASLVRALEENGVGRPSTYAPTIQNIQSRNYVKLEGKAIVPTELGEIVDGLVEQFFPDITSVDYTAKVENDLDEVEKGKEEWAKVVDRYYKPFSKELEKADSEIQKIQIKDQPAGFDCEICGAPMLIKMGRYGKFYGCSRYPECDFVSWDKPIARACPNDGHFLVEKKRKDGIVVLCPNGDYKEEPQEPEEAE